MYMYRKMENTKRYLKTDIAYDKYYPNSEYKSLDLIECSQLLKIFFFDYRMIDGCYSVTSLDQYHSLYFAYVQKTHIVLR